MRAAVRQDVIGVARAVKVGRSTAFGEVDLFVDGYGFFFAALILVIGLLIITYARWYLNRDDPVGRFYSYLLLFQGAMLGIVLSDNVLVLIVFWELTSLTSFLLIGYWHHRADARRRRGARPEEGRDRPGGRPDPL